MGRWTAIQSTDQMRAYHGRFESRPTELDLTVPELSSCWEEAGACGHVGAKLPSMRCQFFRCKGRQRNWRCVIFDVAGDGQKDQFK